MKSQKGNLSLFVGEKSHLEVLHVNIFFCRCANQSAQYPRKLFCSVPPHMGVMIAAEGGVTKY